MSSSRREEYERIRSLVNQWNDDHLDIFELSEPNKVNIFYFANIFCYTYLGTNY